MKNRTRTCVSFRAAIAGTLFAVLCGCAAAAGDYPSLAVRDTERVTGSFAPAPSTYTLPPTPAAVVGQLDSIAEKARAAHSSFTKELPAVSRVVAAARGQMPGSENWARAQVALANLVAERSQVMVALADLDRLYVAVAIEGNSAAPIEAIVSEVTSLMEEENTALQDLLANLN